MELGEFLENPDTDPMAAGDGEIGLPRRACARRWFSRFCRVGGLSTPNLASPLSDDVLSLMVILVRPPLSGMRVRALDLFDVLKHVALKWGPEYKAALRDSRTAPAALNSVARDRDAGLSSDPLGRRRVSNPLVSGGS